MNKTTIRIICIIVLISAMMVMPAAAQLADTPWPMFQHDLQHTGQSPYIGAQEPTVDWTYFTDGYWVLSPVIDADGTIYIGSDDGNLYALNPDGTKKWNFVTGDYIESAPAIDTNGTIYIGSGDGNLYALNPDGTKKWEFVTGGCLYESAPAIDTNGTIYFGSHDHKFYALNPDGTKKWEFVTGDLIYSSPAIDADGTIYFGSNDNKLYALNPDGSKKWDFVTGMDITSAPAIGADGTIYFGSMDDKLYALNPDGSKKWEFVTGDDVYQGAAIGADGTIYFGSSDNKLYALNPDGSKKWEFATLDGIWCALVIDADGTIYFQSDKFYAINPDGSQKWELANDGYYGASGGAIGADGTVYFQAGDGYLYAIGPGLGLPAPPDLTPTAITPNCGGYLFDGNNNEICALIENNDGFASAFSVRFDINGDIQEVAVSGLAAGENTTVCVTDPTIRNAGDPVTITVTADCNDEVTEENETNNVLSSSETVVYNGYKGKRYTGGEDITTKNTFDLNGDLVYSAGDSYYLSSYSYPHWTTYDVSWTDAELVIPPTATVVNARLYVPYTWDKAGVMSGVSLTFNAVAQTPDAHYSDEKMYGTSYPYGMLAYDVTGDFDTAGNIANLTNLHTGGGNVSMRGMMLVVVYEDATEPRRQIFVGEEFDLIYGGSNYCTTPGEATAWAPITGAAINPALTANARLITFAPGADGTGSAGEGELIFNGQTWNDEWTDNEVHQIGISDRDVTSHLLSTGNEVGFQSNADWMEASNAILVVEENIFSNNIYLEPEDSSASYEDTALVEVYADTTDLHQGGQFYLTYPQGCANITEVTFDSIWPYVTKDLTTYPGAVFVTFRKGEPMVSGVQPICTLSVQCENPGYCQGDMHFALSGEVDASMVSELYDDMGGSLTDLGWHDGTFTCMNLADLVVTEVYGEQQTGDDYIVHYTVTNEGNAAAAAGHTTSLSIGEIGGPYAGVEDQVVSGALAPGESYTGTFGTVVTMTAPNDEMKVCADTGSDVMELDETNNCMVSIYPAGIELSVDVLDDGECVEFQEQFLVNINIDPRNIPVYGIQYVLSFDNTVLHAEWQNEGTFLNSDGAETTMYINTIDNGAGTISFAATRVGDVGGIANPSGTLAVIKFTASQQGASSTLTLSEVVAANDAGNEINPVDLIDDEVCISANIAPVAAGESLDMYNNDGQKYICKVYFDGTASYDPDGALVNWRWSFGDGNYGTGETVDHVYQSWNWNTVTGEYEPFNVSLTVTDDADPHQLDDTTYFEVMVYTAGDANADGKVNILDATIVGLEWGETTTYGTRTDQADLNNDGKVNILDAVIIGTCWGHTAW